MLTVYRSNRAEWLATLLAQQLQLTPPDPFQTIEVIVNTWPTSRWLSEQLSVVTGISALIKFPFPAANSKMIAALQKYLHEDNSMSAY